MRFLKKYPGVLGWVAVAVVVVVADVELATHHKPTMSRTIGEGLRHPILGPILAGGWLGLSYHLVVEELLNAIFDRDHL